MRNEATEVLVARQGLDLAKSTVCGWHETLAELAAAWLAAMFVDALGASRLRGSPRPSRLEAPPAW